MMLKLIRNAYRNIIEGFNKKENKNQTSYRSHVYTDWELPIFDLDFFKNIGVIK